MDELDRRTARPLAGSERSQDYRDLLRLVATIRSVVPRDPLRQAVREQLLAKLAAFVEMPAMVPGGARLA